MGLEDPNNEVVAEAQPDPMAPDKELGVDEPKTIEQEYDDFLESIDGNEEEIGVPAEEQTQQEEAPQEEAPQEDTPSDQEEVREQPESQKDVAPELEKAMAALRRDGLPQTLIEKMSNEEVLEYGEKRAKVQGDTDDAYRQLSELKNGKETPAESNETSETVAESAEVTPVVDLKEAVQPFAEIFGEDAAQALQSVTEAAIAPYVQQLQTQAAAMETLMVDSARNQLVGEYPGLSTPEGYSAVTDRMKSLLKTGDYSDVNTLMADASRITFASESNSQAQNYQTKLAQDRNLGQMTPSDKGSVPQKSMTSEDRDDAMLAAIEAGMSAADARSTYGAY